MEESSVQVTPSVKRNKRKSTTDLEENLDNTAQKVAIFLAQKSQLDSDECIPPIGVYSIK
jgi:hypothetical protein